MARATPAAYAARPAVRSILMTEDPAAAPAWLAEQPHVVVERDGVRYTLLGTAHVSKASVDAVRAAIDSGRYDSVAVELDEGRLRAISDPDALAKLDLVKVLREGKTALFAANLGLAAYQRRLAEQLGIEPGAELKAAVDDAHARGLPMNLIDRDVGITFKRASQRLGWWGRMKLVSGLAMSLFADEQVGDEEIEKLKQGDLLEASFGEFARESPALYAAIISERDLYMAARLRETAGATADDGPREVLAVVGAGHLKGLSDALANDTREPSDLLSELRQVRERRRIPWITLALTLLILGGIAWGFWRGGFDVGADLLLQWTLFMAGGAALGCIAARGHPLGVLLAAVAAPLKPFRPGVPPGLLSALVEVRYRKPAHADFMALRDDVQTVGGWYRNRVSRVLLNFILTNLGSSIGFWIAGAQVLRKVLG